MKYTTNVIGAPYSINARVKIGKGSDDAFDKKLKGKTGKIVYYNYERGTGQTFPADPLIGVNINGRISSFWKEELKLYTHGKITK